MNSRKDLGLVKDSYSWGDDKNMQGKLDTWGDLDKRTREVLVSWEDNEMRKGPKAIYLILSTPGKELR
jgi:hypothetical protein